jgi:hypothetical protein
MPSMTKELREMTTPVPFALEENEPDTQRIPKVEFLSDDTIAEQRDVQGIPVVKTPAEGEEESTMDDDFSWSDEEVPTQRMDQVEMD